MSELMMPPAVSAGQWSVPAAVVGIIDGDTAKVTVSAWPHLTWSGSVRVRGIDAPELRGGCDAEREAALAARTLAIATFQGAPVLLLDIEDDKFGGRVLASVRTLDGIDWAEKLVSAGLAKPWAGMGPKPGWCPP